MNSLPQLRGVFPSPTNVSNFKPASRPGPRRLYFGSDSPQRVHKPVPSKKKVLVAAAEIAEKKEPDAAVEDVKVQIYSFFFGVYFYALVFSFFS